MNKVEIIEQCIHHNEFYMHYQKLRDKGVTYLQGTTDFSDKYLSKRFEKENIKPADDKHILVFSRTNDSFRYIPVSKVRRITSLQSELDRASPVGK